MLRNESKNIRREIYQKKKIPGGTKDQKSEKPKGRIR